MSGIIRTIKAKDDNNVEQNIFPKTVLEAVVDSVSGKTLDILMNEFVPEGTTYVDKEESEEIDTNVDKIILAKYVNYDNTNSKLEANTVQEALDTVSSITKGKNRARVFNTTEDMNAWLSDEDNKGKAIVGDNLYIVALDVPDWWISEVLEEADAESGFYYKIAQLETQKVDLTTIESSISNIETRLITGVSLVNHDFNDLGDKPLIGIGNSMINAPLENTAFTYLVIHLPAYNDFAVTQFARALNYGDNGTLYHRQRRNNGTWNEWDRVPTGTEITTINDSITTMNNSINTITNRVNSIHNTFYLGGGVKTVDIKMTGGGGAIVQGYALGNTGIDGVPFSLMIRRSNDWSTVKVTSLTDHSESNITAVPSETSGYITLDLSPVSSWGFIKGTILYLI